MKEVRKWNSWNGWNNSKRLRNPVTKPIWKRRNLVSKSCNKPKNFSWSTSKREKSMSLLDVQHIKRSTKPVFKGTQVEALKDIFTSPWKGVSTWLSWGNQDLGNRPFSISWPCWISRPKGRVYPQRYRYFNYQNKDASSFRREKLGFVFQDFNLLDTLSVKDNIPSPLVLSRRPVKGNDD